MKIFLSFLNLKTIYLKCVLLIIIQLMNATYGQKFCNETIVLTEKDAVNGISPNLNADSIRGSCWLKFKTSKDFGIRLDFVTFNLEKKMCKSIFDNTETCCDYMEVGYGSQVYDNSFGKYCGMTKPESIIFDQDNIWINVYKFSENIDDLIKITLKPVRVVHREQSHLIHSPKQDKYMNFYLNNLDFTNKILAPVNHITYFRFQDTFSIESNNGTCNDYLDIGVFKNKSHEKPEILKPIKTFCGSEAPNNFIIESNQTYIRFVTDKNVTESGYTLLVRMIKNVFTEPKGVIELTAYPINITYTIKAPRGQKIELTIEEFNFPTCVVKETDRLLSSNGCSSSNDYVLFENQRGSIGEREYESMNALPSESDRSVNWTFCACQTPVKTYISLNNEINLKYFSMQPNKERNLFKISYKFIRAEQTQSNQLRIVQDHTISYINGYYLKVKVPVNNHIRFFGKSTKCSFPKYSLITQRIQSSYEKKVQLIEQPFILKSSEFKRTCSYLFDLQEPHFENGIDTSDNLVWEVDWYLKFDNSSVLYDFELNWVFVKNEIYNDKHSSFINLPEQTGFESNELLNDYLRFHFRSLSKNRKYSLGFYFGQDAIKDNEVSQNVLIIPKGSSKQKVIPTSLLNQKDNLYEVESTEFLLKIRREKLSLVINYQLDSQIGDCDFDSSFCGYTTSLLVNSSLFMSKVLSEQREVIFKHLPKYNSLDTNDLKILDKAKDFYLSITESKDNISSIFSPLIDVQSELSSTALFNKKVFSLSFKYLMANDSGNEVEVFLINRRSDTQVPIIENLKKPIARYGPASYMIDSSVSMLTFENDCPMASFTSVLNTFALSTPSTLVNDMDSSSSVLNNIRNNQAKSFWYKVNKLKIFSCYNFKFGFKFHLNTDNKATSSANIASTIGIDDIELNYEHDATECKKNQCTNNGQCYEFDGESFCCCNPGFTGENCEKTLSPCESALTLEDTTNICKNNGECVDDLLNFDYKCKCPDGYSGKNCEIEINECDENPCLNDGKCIDLIGTYECVCRNGFSGKRCGKKEIDCTEKCSEIGTVECFNQKSDVICQCKPDFTGKDCSLKMKIDRCMSSPCVDNAECINDINQPNGYKCVCPENKTGKNCEISINFCEKFESLCKNGSRCLLANSDGSRVECSCEAGFTGKFCETPIDECNSKPCLNGGVCKDHHLSYSCECSKGYVGMNCEIELEDPCYKNKCEKGKCVPSDEEGYTCECYPNAYGQYCEKDKCTDEVFVNDICSPNGTLSVINNQQTCICICKQGYHGVKCEKQMNLCDLRSKYIDSETECKNGGSCVYDYDTNKVTCLCPDGFSGDRCEMAENYCKENPCKYGRCISEEKGFRCICTKGYEGDNCDTPTDYCNGAECVFENTADWQSTKTGCNCVCKLGFTGEKCHININDCVDENNQKRCKNNGKCIDSVASYSCECPMGFSGLHCERNVTTQITCQSNPCKYGFCEEVAGNIKCVCDRGFMGDLCDEPIDRCQPNPCKNSGKCLNLIDDYYCACPPEYGTSRNCSERFVDPCNSSPCYNNGTCMPITTRSDTVKNEIIYTNFTCKCLDGFKGDLCEITTDLCSSNPCQNRGRCELNKFRDSENKRFSDYTCKCFPAFTGRNCETYFNQCESSPCKNGGKCLATPEGFLCECPFNFGGRHCEEVHNPCDSMKCMNHGECLLDGNHVPYCKCLSNRYVGTRCEIDLTNKDIQRIFSPPSSKLTASFDAQTSPKCDILGNDITTIDYVFVALILFCIIIFVIVIIYLYVYFRLKRSKSNLIQGNSEKDSFEEMTEISNKYA